MLFFFLIIIVVVGIINTLKIDDYQEIELLFFICLILT